MAEIGKQKFMSGIKRKGDVIPAGEKFREIVRQLTGRRSLRHERKK